jgi:hypothetical protein
LDWVLTSSISLSGDTACLSAAGDVRGCVAIVTDGNGAIDQ